jgi:ketosteroid isomerase-like protein
MSQENVDAAAETLRAGLRAFNDGDFEIAFAGLAPDVEWLSGAWVLDAQVLHGRAAVIDFFCRVRDAGDWHVEAQEFLVAREGCVMVHQRGRSVGRTTRIEGTMDFFQVWEFGADGLVDRVREYESRGEALKAVGLED